MKTKLRISTTILFAFFFISQTSQAHKNFDRNEFDVRESSQATSYTFGKSVTVSIKSNKKTIILRDYSRFQYSLQTTLNTFGKNISRIQKLFTHISFGRITLKVFSVSLSDIMPFKTKPKISSIANYCYH